MKDRISHSKKPTHSSQSMFAPTTTSGLCIVRHIPPKKLAPGKVNPFKWNEQLDALKLHVHSYGVNFDYEKTINAAIEQAVFDRNFDYLSKMLSLYKLNSSLNIEALTQFVFLQAVCYAYNKEDFHQLLEKFPIDIHKKIHYYVTIAHVNEAPSESSHPAEYTETLKEFTIRFGAKELTAVIEKMEKAQDQESVQEQDVTKKRRLY